MTARQSATGELDDTQALELKVFYAELARIGVAPLWESLTDLVPSHPKPQDAATLWRWRDLRSQLRRAGELVPVERAERRVLMLLNPTPSVAERGGTTSTLYAGIQLVLPGEVARAHRHVMGAFRFVIEGGDGAYTTVNGEQAFMSPGDLVLTPNWNYHDHGNESDAPVVWLDGLDLPLVNHLNANFFELHPETRQPVTEPANASTRRYAHGHLNPVAPTTGNNSPIVNYPWADTEKALREGLTLANSRSPDSFVLEYTNPLTGNSVMPTMNCYIEALRPSQHVQARRRTPSAIFHVVRGCGSTIIDGHQYNWEEKDIFCVPSWSTFEHINRSPSEDAVLFSYSNQGLYERLGLYREQIVPRQA